MLRIIALICAAHAPICDATTALDVVRGPLVATPQRCAFESQALLASTVLTDPNTTVVVRCTRDDARVRVNRSVNGAIITAMAPWRHCAPEEKMRAPH